MRGQVLAPLFLGLLAAASLFGLPLEDQAGDWITRGFDAFSQGTMGNAGQNLYVSKAGILQRIHQFDLNQDGYLDLFFANCQEYREQPDAFIYSDVFGKASRRVVPSDGAVSGAVLDLNRDGYDDLVLAMGNNGTRADLNAFVYFGDPRGLSQRRLVLVPAPGARSVTAGDFNGDKLPDLAFSLGSRARLFYQGPLGFEPRRFVDLDIRVDQVASGDLDRDDFADLLARDKEGQTSVYWGGPVGLNAARRVIAPIPTESEPTAPRSDVSEPERPEEPRPMADYVSVQGRACLVIFRPKSVHLVPLDKSRRFGEPIVLKEAGVVAAAAGDVNGNGIADLVLVSHSRQSSVYWDLGNGLRERTRTELGTSAGCDVELADLDQDGLDDIIVCQDRSETFFTYHSLVFKGARDGLAKEPVKLESQGARRVLVGRTSEGAKSVILVNQAAGDAGGRVNAYIYWGGADGFQPGRRIELSARGAIGALGADVNDDRVTDVVLANSSEDAIDLDPGSFLFFGGTDGFAFEPSVVFSTRRAYGLVCADLNRDGYLDFVFDGFSNPDLVVFYGSETGYVESQSVHIPMRLGAEVYDQPRWLHLADFDRDGWLDMVVPQIAFDRSFILWGGPQGFAFERRQALSVWHGSYADSADLDGNGWLDLVIGGHMPSREGPHDSFVYVYWNGPKGLREDHRTQLPANAVNALGIRDLSNDNWLDLLVCNYHDNRFRDIDSFIYWGGPEGFSASRMFRLPAHSASGTILNDFNGDGWVDIAIAHHKVEGDHVGNSAVWWNSPTGFSPDRRTLLPTKGPHGMIVVDPGNQMDREDEEFYISAPYQLPSRARVEGLAWKADVPTGTWVRGEIRTADTAEALSRAVWRPAPALPKAGETPALPEERWVQYRLALGAKGGGRTPRVSEVRLRYRSMPGQSLTSPWRRSGQKGGAW
ncbi:MAG: FG-GAP repeat domain-containing protein [Acidobacteriota bacterium]